MTQRCHVVVAARRALRQSWKRWKFDRLPRGVAMSKPPAGRRPMGARDAAEAAFKSATTKPIEQQEVARQLPGVRELVSLRIDQDVLEHFRAMGRDWPERINEALRRSIKG
jgi:uncharacterized protein (DUF4415 family)